MKPYLPYLLLLLLVFSCKPGEDEIPSYIHVPAFEVFTTPSQGSTSHKITDAWVYVNNELQGIYQLPATFPVLASGNTKVTLSPGIMANGISTTRVQYPFYTDTIMYVDLVPTETDTLRPAVTYRTAPTFLLNEDFENGNEFQNIQRIADASIAFEGGACGKFIIDDTRKTRILTSNTFQVSQIDGVVLFMELNYKTTHVMKAGIIATSSQGTVVISKVNISPQQNWNKIYLNFTPEINGTLATSFQFFLEVDASGSTDPVELYIDNVKILLE